MRAWQVQGSGEPTEVFHLVEREPPEPGPGQVQVRVTAAGIGLPDVLMCRGVYPLTPPLPFTPGQEMAGVVSAVGDGVDTPVGTRVMSTSGFVEGNGSFAEYTVAHAAQVFPVPEALDDASAAGFWIPHMTGWIGLVDRGQIREGDWLAVLGAAGGSGIAAVQLGKALGGSRRRRRQRPGEGGLLPQPRRRRHRARRRRRRSVARCARRPAAPVSICSTTRSAARRPRRRSRRWPATVGCSPRASPAVAGRTSTPTTS